MNVHDGRFYSFAFKNSPHSLRSSETEQVERVKATQRKQLSPNVNGTETNQQQKNINADLKNNWRINKMSSK